MSHSFDNGDDGANFDELMGAFGVSANVGRRAKAERMASIKPTDGRRRKAGSLRSTQLNTRVNDQTVNFVALLIERFTDRDGRKWSQPDLVEHAIAALARAEKIKGA